RREAVREAPRHGTVVLVHHEQPGGPHLARRGVGEGQELGHRHHEQHPDNHPVAEDLQELLAKQEAKCPHRQASLALKLRIATTMKKRNIAQRTSSSSHRWEIPVPLSMMPREMTMNHRAGITTVTGWSQPGRLAMG